MEKTKFAPKLNLKVTQNFSLINNINFGHINIEDLHPILKAKLSQTWIRTFLPQIKGNPFNINNYKNYSFIEDNNLIKIIYMDNKTRDVATITIIKEQNPHIMEGTLGETVIKIDAHATHSFREWGRHQSVGFLLLGTLAATKDIVIEELNLYDPLGDLN